MDDILQSTAPKDGGSVLARMRKKRHIITIILAVCAIGLEIFYSFCSDACSYLQGTFFGMPLQYIGIAYMLCLVFLAAVKKDTLLFLLICAGVGIEFYLIGFQIRYDTYCSYCLAFAGVIFLLFFLNVQRPLLIPGAIVAVVALILFSIFFKGSVMPVYTYTFLNEKTGQVSPTGHQFHALATRGALKI